MYQHTHDSRREIPPLLFPPAPSVPGVLGMVARPRPPAGWASRDTDTEQEEKKGKGHSLLGCLFAAAGNQLHKDESLRVRLGKTH